VPSLPPKSFSAKRGPIALESGKSGLKAALFPGCVPDKLFPSLSEATLKALRHHGVGVFMPANLVCCGIPALASGDRKAFRELVRLNLRALEKQGYDWLVTPCATCAANIKENWHRFRDDFRDSRDLEAIDRLHARTADITYFLAKVANVPFPEAPPAAALGEARTVTYHDPCHLKKSLGVSAEPRAILKSLPGYRYKEMAEADRCCGNGGSFNLFHYDLSKEIGERKSGNVTMAQAQVVATGCPACMMQLMDSLSQAGERTEVRHVVELYADSL
jgi:glycolate oxidase iron-sulfur subunit